MRVGGVLQGRLSIRPNRNLAVCLRALAINRCRATAERGVVAARRRCVHIARCRTSADRSVASPDGAMAIRPAGVRTVAKVGIPTENRISRARLIAR